MDSRYVATLNGINFADIDERLLILNVNHDPPGYQTSKNTIANKNGSWLGMKRKDVAKVTISFEIHVYLTDERQEVLQRVIAWARDGGTLQLNDRPGQILNCVCDEFPSISSVKDWTAPLSIVFCAYALPYWQDETATIVSLSGSNASGQVDVPGNGGDSNVDVTITPRGTLTSIRLSAGATYIELSGINVASGRQLVISHDSNQILHITANGVSLLANRTGQSSDDLQCPSGKISRIATQSNVPVTATFSVRGNWE